MRALTFILLITLAFSLKLSDILDKSFEVNKMKIIREEQEPKDAQEKEGERERHPRNSIRGPYRSPRNITLIPPSEFDEFEYNRHINFSQPRPLTPPRFGDEENEGEERTHRKRRQKRFDKERKNERRVERRGERRQRREKREQHYNEEEIGEQRARGPGKKRKNMRGRFGIN